MEGQDSKLIFDDNTKFLDLSGLGINQVPAAIFKLPNLRSLDLSNNRLKRIPEALFHIPTLHDLDLSFNKLTKLSFSNRDISSIRKLNLSNNKIDAIQGAEKKFPELQELDLGNNKIQALEHSFLEGMVLLRVLFLGKNKLNDLPDSFSTLRLLKRLDLSSNCFVDLPTLIWAKPFLESLDLSRNPLVALNIGDQRSNYLKKLDLFQTKLLHIPKEVFQFERLETLDIRGLNFHPYDLLVAGPRLKKIRTKFATASYLNFARRCSILNIDEVLRQRLYQWKVEKKGGIIEGEELRSAMQLLDVGYENRILYDRHSQALRTDGPALAKSAVFFVDSSCGIPAYLIDIWSEQLEINFVATKQAALFSVYGKSGAANFVDKYQISLNTFLRWISSEFYISNEKRAYIESLILAKSDAYQQLGFSIILNKGLVFEFEDQLKSILKGGAASKNRLLRNLLQSLN